MDNKQPHGGLLLSLGDLVSGFQLTLDQLGLGSLRDKEMTAEQSLVNEVA